MLTITSNNAHSFRMMIGLTEEHGNRKLHTPGEVGVIVGTWLARQRRIHRLHLSGSIVAGSMHEEERRSAIPLAEPVAVYEGDVNPEYSPQATDEEVISALQNLADILANRLDQRAIYLRYNGITHILKRVAQ